MQEPNSHHHHHHHNQHYHQPTLSDGGPSLNRSKPLPQQSYVPQGHVAFRLVCHASRVGGVIGKSGSIIKHLQSKTSSKIRVEDSHNPNTDHRVITILSPALPTKKITLRKQGFNNGTNGYGEGERDGEEFYEVSGAQEGVVRVFERVVEVAAAEEEADSDGAAAAALDGLVSSCRLLVDKSQVGAIIGKGGKVIEKIRKDTGCKVKVLTAEKLPPCALTSDEIVEIEGDVLAVKKALVAVTHCIQECPSLDRGRGAGSRHFEVIHQTLPDLHMDNSMQQSSMLQSISTNSFSNVSMGHPLSQENNRFPPVSFRKPRQEVLFNILCSNTRVGAVIGKGGHIIRSLQSETGASISIGPTLADCDERLISITAMEDPESIHSSAQNAVLLVFKRSVEVGFEHGTDSGTQRSVCARLLVPSNQVGCLLGKGGTIISEIRRMTGTSIRIIGGDQVPLCASEFDEVVQITGEFVNVQDALHNVTSRLRHNLLQVRLPNGAGARSSYMTSNNGFNGRLGEPAHGCHQPMAFTNSQNPHNGLMQSMDNLRLSDNVDRPPSPLSASSQAVGGVKSKSVTGAGRGSDSAIGAVELGSGSRSAIVANTTMEIIIPENIFDAVFGENGSNLTQLRQISGAKVMVREPEPGKSDTVLIISGTPAETQAAQSLLQAFILKQS